MIPHELITVDIPFLPPKLFSASLRPTPHAYNELATPNQCIPLIAAVQICMQLCI